MAVSALGQLFRAIAPEKKEGDKTISYSQFAMWSTCPRKWKLTYIDKHRLGGPSIHTVFGTSFHETIQWYLHTMYNSSVKDADNLNLHECLQEQMQQNYINDVSNLGGEHFSSSTELQEFYEDGVAILDWLKKHRVEYFSNQTHELVGIEIPLYIQASDKNPKVIMNGFLDIVLREKASGKIVIIDVKTSTKGWNQYAKADKTKISQLVLYKSYFAKQYGYDEENIDIEYFIVKRKLIDGYMYPQKRVQSFVPASGKPTRKKLLVDIESFIEAGFNQDGTYKEDGIFPAIGDKGLKNCRYCEFSSNEELCPKANRIK
jgi:Holliday junction resolvase-like predicted endonuclease